MPQILVEELSKTYRIAEREAGVAGALKGLVHRRWRAIEALTDVSFAVEAGELVGLIGPNGAGKSTTIKILSGILEPTSGRCEVDGLVPWRQRIRHVARIGVVFGQRTQLWWDLPVIEGFDLLRDIYRVPQDRYARTRDELVALLRLERVLRQPVRQLSLGQRMRCEITASLLHGPQLMFLDEPTIGLDITAKAAIRDFIREQSRDAGQTVLLTSHDTRDIELVCERVIVINDGRIVVDQPVTELRRRARGDQFAGITHRTSEAHTTVIEVDTSRIRVEQVIAAALAQGGIDDVAIEDPPMEEVIHEIYASFARG